MAQAEATVLIDNESVRVTRWQLPPGTVVGFHRHEFDYVVVPLSTARLELLDADGQASYATLETGVPYFRNAGVEHDVCNPDDLELAFVEIELLDHPG
jgi:quercetin dioxygenase-like cupin family protein